MVRIDRLGVSVISPGGQDAGGPDVNIVLVHGLRGHPRKAWESAKRSNVVESSDRFNDSKEQFRKFFRSKVAPRGSSTNYAEDNAPPGVESSRSQEAKGSVVFWPGDFLALAIPNARILTYGYNADAIGALFQPNNQNSISQHGNDLMVKLERAVNNNKPIIFIAHSMGGIIVKDALCRCKTSLNERYRSIHQRTDTVIFLGTPHRGSSSATWGEIASSLAAVALQDSNRNLFAATAVDSEVLDNIHGEFMKMLHTNDFRVHSFQEGRGMSGIKGFSGKVVSDFSSKIGYPLEVVETIDANHVEMAKFAGTRSPGYQDLLQALQGYIEDFKGCPDDRSSALSKATPYLHKLYCVDYERVFEKIPSPYEGTCSWLRQNPTFKDWKTSPNSSLCWLYGFPGYGKTVLAKSVVQSLMNLSDVDASSSKSRGKPIIVHFFCLDQDERRKSPLSVLRTLLHQFLVADPGLYTHLGEYHATTDWEFLQSLTTLWKLFRKVTSAVKSKPVYIILDALDELAIDSRDEFVGMLLDTIRETKASPPVKVFITSRPESQFQTLLANCPFKIELDTTRNEQDLVQFVNSTVDEFARENSFPAHLAISVRTEIVKKAQGMFLWASLAWESFKSGAAIWNHSAVERQLKALKDLPPGLYPLYHRMLSQVNPRFVPDLNRLFVWLLTAVRPLSTSELAVALALRSHHRATKDIDVTFSVSDFLKRSCPNLVKVDKSDLVSLVHQSFKEFLLRPSDAYQPTVGGLPLFQIHAATAHTQVLMACFDYMCLQDVDALAETWLPGNINPRAKFCFLAYAALEWKYHLRLAKDNEEVWHAFKRITENSARWRLMNGFRIRLSYTGEDYWDLKNWAEASPLTVAANLGLKTLLKRLVEDGADLNGVAILYHCRYSPEIFDYLLELGADPNNEAKFGCTPLVWAVRGHRLPIAKILLKQPSLDPNVRDEDGRTAVHWATRWDWTSVETILNELLSNERLDINVADKLGRTPVAFAAYWGKELAAKRLLQSSKLSLEKGDIFGESALVCSAQQGWEDVFLSMLRRVADVGKHEDRDHRGIIHWTVKNRWDEGLRRVLNKPGCKINKIDSRGMTALHYAAEEGNYFAARLLLKAGAMADIMDNTGKTPAHVAAQCVSTQVLRLLLLERTLDVNEQDINGRTVMHWVAIVDSTSMIHLLLEQGTDLTIRDQDGRTPMHVAAFCGCHTVFRLLLDNIIDYDPNSVDASGNTLLHLAARAGSPTMIGYLLSRGGLIINKRNSFGETALDCSGHSEQLLNAGARYATTTSPFAYTDDHSGNDYAADYGRHAGQEYFARDKHAKTANLYHSRVRADVRTTNEFSERSMVPFDADESFLSWKKAYLVLQYTSRPLCNGKLMDIYSSQIGPCEAYANSVAAEMLGDGATYFCAVCNSDGPVCRERSTALNAAYSRVLNDRKQKEFAEKESAKRYY